MKDKGEGSGGGGGQQAPGGAATTTKRSKKNKGRHFTLSIGPLPQPKFNAIVWYVCSALVWSGVRFGRHLAGCEAGLSPD